MSTGGGQLRAWAFLRHFTLQHWRMEWGQTVLLLLVLGLGVGTFLSIRMANRAAVEGFGLFTETLRGDSDWVISGRDGTLPLDGLTRLREALDSLPAEIYPVVENTLFIHQQPEALPVRLLGLDLVQLRSALLESGDDDALMPDGDFWDMLADPEHLLLSRPFAEANGLQVGDRFNGTIAGRTLPFHLAGLLPEFRGNVPLPQQLAVIDMEAMRLRLGLNTVQRFEIVVEQGRQRAALNAAVGERLRDAAADNWVIETPEGQREAGAAMTAAFRLNLAILSLIALLVSIYLIAQSLDATVSRRRKEIATLRSLGVEQANIQRLWLFEGAIIGLLGGLSGLLIGSMLARFTVEAVTTTVRALYRDTAVSAIGLSADDVLIALAMGLLGSIAACWVPARDAASTPPAQLLRLSQRIPPFALFNKPLAGWLLLLAGGLCALLPPLTHGGRDIPLGGYLAAFLWLTGATIAAAGLLPLIGKLLARLGRQSAQLTIAAGRLIMVTSRHQLAMAGCLVAVAMASAMGFLIASFERTVSEWLEVRLQGDIFISMNGFQGADSDPRIPAAVVDAIGDIAGVDVIDSFVSLPAEVDGQPVRLGASNWHLFADRQQLLWLDAPPQDFFQRGQFAATAIINEALARSRQLSIGSTIRLQTPAGEQALTIVGIQSDFSRDAGLVLVDIAQLRAWMQVEQWDTASLFLDGTVPAGVINSSLQARFPFLKVQSNPQLQVAAMDIFHQTFGVTKALQLISIVVAIAGLVLSLISLLRESGRELGFQRALGMSRGSIAMTTAIEGTAISFAGICGGILLSGMLGWLLIYVINLQSFGWTLQAAYPLADTVLLATTIMTMAFVVSWATGWFHLRKHPPLP